jgi:hypothetical protein
MTAPTVLVHALAGSPEPTAGSVARLLEQQAGVCAVCGQPAIWTADVNRALGANFADRSLFRGPLSSRVCPACLWCCSGKPPATLRMWSIVAAPGVDLGPSHEKAFLRNTPGLLLTNRADPAPVARILGAPPPGEWLVTIAVSGQKHVLPYASVNAGTGRWSVRMENTTVAATPETWREVHGHARALRRLGVPADDVRTGQPRYLKTRADYDAWRAHSVPLASYLGSPLLDLALWCITKKGLLDDD